MLWEERLPCIFSAQTFLIAFVLPLHWRQVMQEGCESGYPIVLRHALPDSGTNTIQLQHKLQDPAFTSWHATPRLVSDSEGVTWSDGRWTGTPQYAELETEGSHGEYKDFQTVKHWLDPTHIIQNLGEVELQQSSSFIGCSYKVTKDLPKMLTSTFLFSTGVTCH